MVKLAITGIHLTRFMRMCNDINHYLNGDSLKPAWFCVQDGLCCNFNQFLRVRGHPHPGIQLFSVAYPFDTSSANYWATYDKYTNPARLNFIREMAALYEQ